MTIPFCGEIGIGLMTIHQQLCQRIAAEAALRPERVTKTDAACLAEELERDHC
jgi:hypothetical protein